MNEKNLETIMEEVAVKVGELSAFDPEKANAIIPEYDALLDRLYQKQDTTGLTNVYAIILDQMNEELKTYTSNQD